MLNLPLNSIVKEYGRHHIWIVSSVEEKNVTVGDIELLNLFNKTYTSYRHSQPKNRYYVLHNGGEWVPNFREGYTHRRMENINWLSKYLEPRYCIEKSNCITALEKQIRIWDKLKKNLLS